VSGDQNLTTPEDTAVTGQIIATDIDGDTLGYAVSGSPTNGTVALNPTTGSFVYTPNSNYNGSDSFVVTISDGKGGSTTSRVNIGVTPVNDAPTSGNQNLTTPEDISVSGAISASDVDGDSLSFSVSGNPANGSVVINTATGSFTYTPNIGYNGSDSFVVTVSDGNGGTTTSTINIGVTPVNDVPVTSNLNLTTDEDTPVNGSVSATDADGDTLSFNVTGAPANGTVVLNPVTGAFTYTPATGYNGSDSFVVTVSDGNGGTVTSTVTIGVNDVNHAPTAATDIATTDESTAVTVAVRGNDTDPDGDSLTVSGVTQGANGSVVIDAVTGNPIYTPNTGFIGSDSFTYTINDGNGGTATATVNVTVNAVNDAPVAVADSITLIEGGTATVLVGGATSILANDTDADGNPLTAILVTGPVNGTLTLNANGTFSYTHNGSETTSDSFTYRVNDGTVDGNTVTVTISVTAVNDAPVANDDAATTSEATAVTVSVRGNDTDPEGNTLTISAVTQGANGLVVIDGATGNPTYTPNAGFTGTDSFTYTVSDGNGDTSTATVNVTVNANQAPVAVDDFYSTNEDTPIVISVSSLLGNDYDPESATLSLTGIPGLTNGTLSYNGSTITFYPNANFTGVASFQYRVSDGDKTDVGTVNITVNPVDDPTSMAPEARTVAEDSFITGNVLSNDSDVETVLQVASYEINSVSYTAGTSTLIPGVGTLLLNTDGTFRFDPVPNYNGAVPIITYTTNTGSSSSLTITVTPVNDAPVAVDDSYSTSQDTPIVISISDLLGNDVDIDGDSLSLISIPGLTNGTLSYNGTTITFYPNPGFSGVASFQYRVSDGSANDVATVNINVAYVNQAPETTTVATTGNEDALVTINLAGTDADGSVAGFIIKSLPANGVLYSDALMATPVGLGDLVAGPVYFMPNANWNGSTSLTYAAKDNLGLEDATPATVAITINPVADSAVLSSGTGTVKEDTPAQSSANGLLTIVDPDAGEAGFQAQTNTAGAYGSFSISSTGSWTYSIDNNKSVVQTLKEGETTTETFTVTSIDGTTTSVVITVTGTNDDPVATADSATTNEDVAVTFAVLGNDTDVDGDTLSVTGATVDPALGSVIVNADNTLTYTPAANINGSVAVTYTISDGNGGTTTATATVTVNPLPDNAVLGSGSGIVKEDTPAQSSTSGLLTIVDPDAGEAGFQAQTNTAGAYGSFSINSAGSWTYNIDNSKPVVQALKAGETKTETFTVTSIDGTATSVVITVNGTNDGPTAVADSGTTLRNATLIFTPAELLGNDTDADGDTLSILSVQDGLNGSVAIVGGNVVFTPTAGYHGPASFTYTVDDGHGGNSTVTVSIDVQKPNTAPVANDDTGAGSVTNHGLYSEFFSYRQGTDGANLENLAQVLAFVNSHSATATFRTTQLDYNPANAFGNGLGMGTNLQTFLGSDAASLTNDPVSTSDAIVRMRGFIELAPGTYNFKVYADDGYQIKIDGVVVAEVAINQVPTATTHTQFTISTGGVHTMEIVYWDQGWNAVFSAEISDDSGMTYDPFSAYTSYQAAVLNLVEDTTLSIPVSSLLGNDTDADGDILSITNVNASPAVNGSVSLVGGNVIFTPTANYSGPASFTYTVSDGKGGTDTATVNLQVTPVNDAPVAVANSLVLPSTVSSTITAASLLANDSDPEGYALSVVSVQNAVNGTVSLSGGNISFTPIAGYEGAASFTYTIQDIGGLSSTATVNLLVGSAAMPALVVNKAIVAVAQGTGGTSVKFPIITSLVDTDGSESLNINVSGVPTGVTFNNGTNLGGGTWSFVAADLAGLQLNLPGSFSTSVSGAALTVSVTAIESNGGATQTVSSIVRLFADYTTTTATTTENGNNTGSSADNHIQGGSGANTISGGSGNDLIYGGAGNDTLNGDAGYDVLYGDAGNDTINGGAGSDRISGGAGNDSQDGGSGNSVDVFAWSLGDQGAAGIPAEDTIYNFGTGAAGNNASGGDVLDLRDLLQGESVGASNGAGNLANYLHFEVSGGNTTIHISHSGGFNADSHTVGAGYTGSAETQKIVLSGVDLQSLYSGATTDQQIITQLLNNNKLITD